MKVIDLLNKIANGEEVPKEIFYKKQWWEYNPNKDYKSTSWGGYLLDNVCLNELNDEVEIIEEKPKHIEEIKDKLDVLTCGITDGEEKTNEVIDKINELTKAINYLLDKDK